MKSNDGKAKVDEVATSIRTVTADSSKMKLLVDEINLGSIEQARGIDQIAKSITQMEQVTQGSAANAEQTAAAAEQLSSQSRTMKEIIQRLRALVDRSDVRHTLSQTASTTHATRNRPARQGGRAFLARTNSVVTFAKSKTSPVAAAVTTSRASSEFPLDDDFREF